MSSRSVGAELAIGSQRVAAGQSFPNHMAQGSTLKKGWEKDTLTRISVLCRNTIFDIVECTSADRRMWDKSVLWDSLEGAGSQLAAGHRLSG